MASNLTDLGIFNIISLVDGNPLVSTYYGPPFQNVVLNGPVAKWEIQKVGENAYRFGVGDFPFSGIVNDRIVATVDPIQNAYWNPVYHPDADAYTIEFAGDQFLGWTVVSDGAPIALKDINTSDPPVFLSTQLFQFWQTGP